MPFGITVTATRVFNRSLPVAGGGKDNQTSDSSIGALIEVEADIELTGTFDAGGPAQWLDCQVCMNPGLFTPARSAYEQWWMGFNAFLTSMAPGDYPTIHQSGTAYEQSELNRSATFTIIDDTHATFKLQFVMTMDLMNYVDGVADENFKRLIYSSAFAPGPGIASTASVYRDTNRRIGLKFSVQEPSATVQTVEHIIPFRSRFQNRGLGNNTPSQPDGEVIGPTYGIQVETWRGGVLADQLSAYQQTEVRVYVDDAIPYTIGNKFRVYVFDITPGTNTVDFPTQIGTGGVEIDAATVTDGQVFGGHVIGIAAPIDSVTYDGQPSKRIRFIVDTDLDPTHTYGALVVLALTPTTGNLDNTLTNTVPLLNQLANGLPTPPAFSPSDFDGTIIDYNRDAATDNVISTITDFLNCKVRVKRSVYDTEAASLGSTWNIDMNGVKFRVVDDITDETLWQLDFQRVPGGWDSGATNQLIETIEDADWNSYELMLHGCFPNDAGLPDFSARTIRIEWRFRVGFAGLQWAIEYQYNQRAQFKGYRNFSAVIQSIALYDYATGLPLESLCQSELVLVDVRLNPIEAGGYDWNIRVGWSLEPHGFPYNAEARPSSLKAEQGYVGELPQLDDSQISALPAEFTGSPLRATFVFDHSTVAVGQKPRLHVIAEPVPGSCPDPTIDLANVIDICATAEFYVEVQATSTPNFTVAGMRVNLNGSWYDEQLFGEGYYFFGPFAFGDTVDVEVVNDGDPACGYFINGLESECGPCDAYPNMPTMIDVDFETTADQQAGLEGSVLTVGWKFLIIDLPNATPPGSTLFEQNTGNIATYAGPGAGAGGSDWNITVLAPGTVVNILANAGMDDNFKWFVVRGAAAGTALYPSGKMCLYWLYPIRSGDDDTDPGSRFFDRSIYTDARADSNNLSNCRIGKVFLSADNSPGSYVNPFGVYGELDGMTILGEGDLDNIWGRIEWYGGPTGTFFQGYSNVRFFAP